jgi:hypothetical protein
MIIIDINHRFLVRETDTGFSATCESLNNLGLQAKTLTGLQELIPKYIEYCVKKETQDREQKRVE